MKGIARNWRAQIPAYALRRSASNYDESASDDSDSVSPAQATAGEIREKLDKAILSKIRKHKQSKIFKNYS